MNKAISLDGKFHKTAWKYHISNNRRTSSMRSPDICCCCFRLFSFWFYCTVVFFLRGAVTLDHKASLYTASNCSLYITAGVIESDDKIKSGLLVLGSPLVIPSFCSFHKTSSYIQGRISLEYAKWGSEPWGEGERHIDTLVLSLLTTSRWKRMPSATLGGLSLLCWKEWTATPMG